MIPVSAKALLGSYAKKMRDIIHEVQSNETDDIVIHKLAEIAADCAWCAIALVVCAGISWYAVESEVDG